MKIVLTVFISFVFIGLIVLTVLFLNGKKIELRFVDSQSSNPIQSIQLSKDTLTTNSQFVDKNSSGSMTNLTLASALKLFDDVKSPEDFPSFSSQVGFPQVILNYAIKNKNKDLWMKFETLSFQSKNNKNGKKVDEPLYLKTTENLFDDIINKREIPLFRNGQILLDGSVIYSSEKNLKSVLKGASTRRDQMGKTITTSDASIITNTQDQTYFYRTISGDINYCDKIISPIIKNYCEQFIGK